MLIDRELQKVEAHTAKISKQVFTLHWTGKELLLVQDLLEGEDDYVARRLYRRLRRLSGEDKL